MTFREWLQGKRIEKSMSAEQQAKEFEEFKNSPELSFKGYLDQFGKSEESLKALPLTTQQAWYDRFLKFRESYLRSAFPERHSA